MIEAAVDHIAIAVRDMPSALRLYRDVLGARFLFAGDQQRQGFRWAQFALPGGGKVELVTPLRNDSFLTRFLNERGEGPHHVTLRVPDIVAAIEQCRAAGIEPVQVSIGDPDWKEAFIHPRDANGVLIQLAQPRLSDDEFARHHLEPHDHQDHRHVSLEEIVGNLAAGQDERGSH